MSGRWFSLNGKEKEKLIRQLEESQDGAEVHVLERFFGVWSWFLFFGREGKGEIGERAVAGKGLWCREPARGRRVCSFIGVGLPWPLRSPTFGATDGKEVALGCVGEEEVGSEPGGET